MKLNLEKMGREDLIDLRGRVDEAIASLETREKDAALKAAQEAALAHGYSLTDLGLGSSAKGRSKGKASGAKAAAKYRNPADPTQTWSGRGRRPQWFKDAEAAGTDLSTLLI